MLRLAKLPLVLLHWTGSFLTASDVASMALVSRSGRTLQPALESGIRVLECDAWRSFHRLHTRFASLHTLALRFSSKHDHSSLFEQFRLGVPEWARSVTCLVLEGSGRTLEKPLGSLVAALPRLTSLQVCGMQIRHNAMALWDRLGRHGSDEQDERTTTTAVHTVVIRNIEWSRLALLSFARSIERWDTVTDLTLDQSHAASWEARKWLPSVGRMKNLRRLCLNRFVTVGDQCAGIGLQLDVAGGTLPRGQNALIPPRVWTSEGFANVQHLDLSHSCIGTEGIVQLTRELTGRILETLILVGTCLGPGSLWYIQNALEERDPCADPTDPGASAWWPSLRTLDLSQNGLLTRLEMESFIRSVALSSSPLQTLVVKEWAMSKKHSHRLQRFALVHAPRLALFC